MHIKRALAFACMVWFIMSSIAIISNCPDENIKAAWFANIAASISAMLYKLFDER